MQKAVLFDQNNDASKEDIGAENLRLRSRARINATIWVSETVEMLTIVTTLIAGYWQGCDRQQIDGCSQPNRSMYSRPTPKLKQRE